MDDPLLLVLFMLLSLVFGMALGYTLGSRKAFVYCTQKLDELMRLWGEIQKEGQKNVSGHSNQDVEKTS